MIILLIGIRKGHTSHREQLGPEKKVSRGILARRAAGMTREWSRDSSLEQRDQVDNGDH